MHFRAGIGILVLMGKSPVTLDAARAAKASALRRFARVPEINGIGLSRRGDGYAVKINCETEPSVEIPNSIDGVEVITEIVGKIRKLAGREHPPTYHVVPDDEEWAVRRERARGRSSVHRTQREAIAAARELARDARGVLVIHSRDGSVRRASYTDDS